MLLGSTGVHVSLLGTVVSVLRSALGFLMG
jgi:hypothetical protein